MTGTNSKIEVSYDNGDTWSDLSDLEMLDLDIDGETVTLGKVCNSFDDDDTSYGQILRANFDVVYHYVKPEIAKVIYSILKDKAQEARQWQPNP